MKAIKIIIVLVLLGILNYFLLFHNPNSPASLQESDTSACELRKSFYKSGELKGDAQFVDNEIQGVAHNYYKSGSVHSEIHYEHGVKNGLSTWYYKNGTVYRTSPYSNGKLNGIQTKYYKNKSIKAEIPYKHGKVVKGTKEYSESGKLIGKYPKIIINKVDNNSNEGRIVLRVGLSKKVEKLTIEAFTKDGEINQNVPLSKISDGNYMCVIPSEKLNSSKRIITFQATFKSNLGNKVLIDKNFAFKKSVYSLKQ